MEEPPVQTDIGFASETPSPYFLVGAALEPGQLEAAFPLSADASTGDQIGFDVQVNNDDDGDGLRDSVVTWNDHTHQGYQNTSGWVCCYSLDD